MKIDGRTFITPQEAAELLKIPRPTVYQWCRNELVDLLDQDFSRALKDRGLSDSQYLIELESLLERHKRVHLGV